MVRERAIERVIESKRDKTRERTRVMTAYEKEVEGAIPCPVGVYKNLQSA